MSLRLSVVVDRPASRGGKGGKCPGTWTANAVTMAAALRPFKLLLECHMLQSPAWRSPDGTGGRCSAGPGSAEGWVSLGPIPSRSTEPHPTTQHTLPRGPANLSAPLVVGNLEKRYELASHYTSASNTGPTVEQCLSCPALAVLPCGRADYIVVAQADVNVAA